MKNLLKWALPVALIVLSVALWVFYKGRQPKSGEAFSSAMPVARVGESGTTPGNVQVTTPEATGEEGERLFSEIGNLAKGTIVFLPLLTIQ